MEIISEEIKDLSVNDKNGVCNKQTYGTLYKEMAECCLGLGDKIRARKYVKKSDKYFNHPPECGCLDDLKKRIKKSKHRMNTDEIDILKPCGLLECTAVEKRPKEFQMCSGCRNVVYCCKNHQKKHWKQGHKLVCKKICELQARKIGIVKNKYQNII